MHDPAHLPDPLFLQQGQRLRVRVAAVDHHRLAEAPGHVELTAEHRGLHVGRREVAEEIEPHLAEGHHLGRAAREGLHRLEVGVGGVGGVVGVDAHGGVHDGQPLREGDRGRIGLAVGPDRDHPDHAGRARPRQHLVQVGGQIREVQVRVGVEERRRAHHDPGCPGGSGSALTFMIRGPSISTIVKR